MTNSLRLNNQNQNSLRVWELLGAGGGGENNNTVSVSLSAKRSDGSNFPTGVYEKGVNYTGVTFTLKVTPLKATEFPVTAVALYKDGTSIQTFTPSSSATSYTHVADVNTTTTFKGEAKTSKQTASSQLKYTFVDPMFYGMQLNIPTPEEVVNMNKMIRAKGKVTCPYNSGEDSVRAWFAYPKEYGPLTSIKDDYNYEYIMAFQALEMTLSLHSNNVDYLVYVMLDESILDVNYTYIF
jgi:hypothetical protein